MKPLLVGENNPYGNDPKFALYPLPENSAGGRLCRLVLGVRMVEYLRTFDRVNLLQAPKWSAPKARDAAYQMLVEQGSERKIILCGRKVFDAFAPHFAWSEWEPLSSREGRFLLLPHPSGLNRYWAEPGSYARAREAIARFVGDTCCDGDGSDRHEAKCAVGRAMVDGGAQP